MDTEMLQQLESWKRTLATELAALEAQLDQIRSAATEKKEKIAAIDKLIAPSKDTAGALPNMVEDLVDDVLQDSELFTPTKAYWCPLLQTLVELGGRGRREKVTAIVGEKMKGILTRADYGRLPTSNYIRWENRVAWQASNMRRDGLMKDDSPRGIWEITDAGRKWLDDNKG